MLQRRCSRRCVGCLDRLSTHPPTHDSILSAPTLPFPPPPPHPHLKKRQLATIFKKAYEAWWPRLLDVESFEAEEELAAVGHSCA